MGVIYKLSFPSGKVYIGQTTKNPKKRWHLHRVRANHCWYLARAIKRHGWENVKKEVLVELPNGQLNMYEAKFIAAYGCIRPGGYNLTPGGDYNPMSDAKVRQRQLKKVQDQAHREAQREHSKEWHTDPIKHKEWAKKNAVSAASLGKRESHRVHTTASWKNPNHRKNRVDGLARAFDDPATAQKRKKAAAEGIRKPEARAKRLATTLRKREELLAKLPPEKREAKRRDLEKRAAKARAKYVPR